ncbi:TPA: hypothetical protein GXC67_04845 [Shigella sonnei]|uniref:hypothetical protein n=1 Tax=Enterobacteriaceae TaxID=543 RepID=UPI00066422A0|nr:hypothetical protein [Shigella sonnei]CSS96394.1 putative phage-like protein [Shigella sonnei]HAJ9949547.1 hypothetical protein [Shigella sonnei]HAJ9957914.1 hypothetical protein [Shigella sonnei]HDW7606985.1 hypothetical protein [Escherichia coli]
MTTITDKKQYPGEQYLNELITNIEFAARAPVEVVRAMAAELQKRREADSAEPVSQTYKLTFEQWLERQHGKIDVDCGCVSTETLLHWMRVAYEAGNSPVTPDGHVQFSVSLPAAFGGDKYFIDGVFQPLRYERDCERAVVAAGGVVNWVK